MSNLFGIGLSGLGAAQAGLNTASNNISNVNTPGYTRQSVQFGELADSKGQGGGVNVTGVQRQYAVFLSGQLDAAQSKAAATNVKLNQLTQIDNQLGNGKTGLGPRMQDFFDSLSDLAASPTDASARSSVLGDANDLAGQFNSFANQLSEMNDSVNKQLDSAVAEVNSNTNQIAALNQKIRQTQARTGQPPNHLLDKRDELVSKTQKLINVDVTKNDDGSYNLSVGGHSLVGPDGSHQLTTTQDAVDPNIRRLAYVDANGNADTIPDNKAAGGEVGGLLSFAHGSLTTIRNQFNQTAHTLAATVNAQHRAGRDLNGDPGTNLFTESQPKTSAAEDNQSDATISATFAAGETKDVTADNYQIEYSADKGYQVTRASDGSAVDAKLGPDGKTLSFGGLNVTISGQPADGDRFAVRPLDGAAASFSVAIKDPAKLAAAGANGGKGDNTNANALAALQKSDSVEGNRSFADNYASLVGDVGNQTQSLKIDSDTQGAIVDDLGQAQQSVAGVNLDEENVNLMYYQRMYEANARVIQTASSVFDTILGIAR